MSPINRIPKLPLTFGEDTTIDDLKLALQGESYDRITDFDFPQLANLPWFVAGVERTSTNNAKFIQGAVDLATAAGGGVVLIPPGIWLVGDANTHVASSMHYAVTMKSNVHVIGVDGATLKLQTGTSTDAVPIRYAVFGSSDIVSNFGLHNIIFDFNGTNNGVNSTTLPQGAIAFLGDSSRGDDIRIDGCTFKNSAGSNIILASYGTTSASYVMGKRWWITDNYFYNNGLDCLDFSAIWGWAEQMQVRGNVFYQSSMPASTSIKFACELHGANSTFCNNVISNYTGMNWVAPNYTSAVENVTIDGNIANPILSFGVRFYRNAATEKGIARVHITNNQFVFTDTAPGADGANGVHINMPYSISDVVISGNTIRRPTGATQTVRGVYLGCSGLGEVYTNITISNNQFEGLTRGVYAVAANGAGTIGITRIAGNVFRNMRGTNPIAINYDNDAAAVVFVDTTITDNAFQNDEGTNTNYGIYLKGYFTVIRLQNNHYRSMSGGDLVLTDLVACAYYLGEELRRKAFAAAPAVGTWAVGDLVWNSTPSSGGAPGWICTTAPATFKAMANLA